MEESLLKPQLKSWKDPIEWVKNTELAIWSLSVRNSCLKFRYLNKVLITFKKEKSLKYLMRYEIILPNWDENYYLRQLKK